MKAELKPEELRATDLRIGNLAIHNCTYWWGETIHTTVRVIDVGYDYEAKVYKVFRVAPIKDESNMTGSTGRLSVSPIELSEEWLLKAGFKLIENPEIENVNLKYWAKDALLLFFNESPPFNTYLVGYGFTHEGKYYAATHRWISKVHELQNVYREYRGNELIFNHG